MIDPVSLQPIQEEIKLEKQKEIDEFNSQIQFLSDELSLSLLDLGQSMKQMVESLNELGYKEVN